MEILLKSCEIKDFCGIKHYCNEFVEDTNIIVGRFGCGKTTVIKSLKWVLGLSVKNYEPVKEENNRVVKLKVIPSVKWDFYIKRTIGDDCFYQELTLQRIGNKLYFNDTECKTQKEYVEYVISVFGFESLDRLEQCFFIESFLERPQVRVRNDILCLINAKNVLNNLKMQDNYAIIKAMLDNCESNDEISKAIKSAFKENEENKKSLQAQQHLLENIIAKTKGEMTEKGEAILEQIQQQLETTKKDLFNKEIELSKQEQVFNQYIVESANTLEKTANNSFLEVGWQLFSNRKTNNDLFECCEMIYYDKPFSCLSRGEQLKALISLHYELLQFYYSGGRVPLIIDNATDLGRENISGKEQIILFETQNQEMKGKVE